MKTAKAVYSVVCVFVAAVIGAGFASGREVASFFIEVRGNGLLGIFLTGVLFAVSALGVMSVNRKKACTLRSFYAEMVGKRLAPFAEALLLAFEAYTFSVMVKGTGELLFEVQGLSPFVGLLLLLVPCFFVLVCDVRALVSVFGLVTPLMIFGVVVFALLSHAVPVGAFGALTSAASMLSKGWLLKAFFYAAYNMLGAGMVLVTLRPYFMSKRVMHLSAFCSGAVLSFLLLSVFFAMLPHWLSVGSLALPMLEIASALGKDARLFYAVLLYLAMFTTAVSCGFVIVERFGKDVFKKRVYTTLGLFGIALGFSFFRFSALVGKGFLVFGVLSAFLLIKTLQKGFESIFEEMRYFLRK